MRALVDDGSKFCGARAASIGESVGAIVGNMLALVLVNTHPLWRPWTAGLVTGAWADVVAALSLACAVAIMGHALLLVSRSPLLRRFVACVSAAASLASGLVVYAVFPFDFGALGMGWFDPLMRLILLIALLGGAIGLVVQVLRMAVRLVRG